MHLVWFDLFEPFQINYMQCVHTLSVLKCFKQVEPHRTSVNTKCMYSLDMINFKWFKQVKQLQT